LELIKELVHLVGFIIRNTNICFLKELQFIQSGRISNNFSCTQY